jgi:nitroreductase
MQTLDAISKRASIREYEDKPVSDDLIEKIIDAGRRAPTARAVEPWEFVVIKDRNTLQKLGEIANTGPFIKDAACCIVIFSHDTKYYLEDGCAATENILLAVADLGLGACWVAGDKKPYVKEVSDLLGASTDLKLISLIPVGWPKGEREQSKNRDLKEVLHWEKFAK